MSTLERNIIEKVYKEFQAKTFSALFKEGPVFTGRKILNAEERQSERERALICSEDGPPHCNSGIKSRESG